jgi:transcriptional regulator with PAS, ATPase and Fis domain
MDIWNKILESHTIKVFRIIANQWWGLDVHFYDKSGNYKSNGTPFQNYHCALMQTKKKTAKDCLLSRIENLKEVNNIRNTDTCKFCENFRAIVVPIFAKGDYVGAIMCTGMQSPVNKSLQEQSMRKLTRLGLDKTEVRQCYDKIKIADSHTEANVLKFMKLVSIDISTFFNTLLNEKEIKDELALLMDWKQNGKYKSIIGKSVPMQNIFCKLELIEKSDSPVLIEGETGTGKELIAAAIHYNSILKDKPFVVQNCSAFSDEILSSELFGHEKGSFTGAISEKKGLFEFADGGTLFLDEVGDISMKLQGTLLRVLENGTFYRVGGTEEKRVNVRLVTATNKDLTKQVEKGLFRKDLLYRINNIRLTMAPLRERKEDVLPLFFFFLEHYTKIKNIENKDICPDLVNLIAGYNWPGNVRELRNVAESLITMSGDSKSIEPKHLPSEIIQSSFTEPSTRKYEEGRRLQDTLRFVDKEITQKVLLKAKWNKTAAARELGISRASLNNRIAKFNLQKRSS